MEVVRVRVRTPARCPAEISYTCQSFAGFFTARGFSAPNPSRFTVFYFMLLAVDLFFLLQANFYVTLRFFRVRLSESCSVRQIVSVFVAVVLVCLAKTEVIWKL